MTDRGEPCRLMVDPPAIGAWNMAVDEALLESVLAGGQAALRFYRWSEPTLSLGYFQPYDDRASHAASRDMPVVRRLTGGGAILHDRELTYSLILPPGHRWAAGRDQLYDACHRAIIEVLAQMGVAAALCGTAAVVAMPEPFLCFLRRSPGDILTGQGKIVGSAQRRRRGAVLQHGSIILDRSPAAPEIVGLSGQGTIDADRLADRLPGAFAQRLEIGLVPATIGPGEFARAKELQALRYTGDGWTRQRQA